MKAAEVLRLYEAGRRDFQGVSLRGQNFKGKDLSGADFSGADIRSTNFSNANLTEANFTQAKAGLQRRWAIGLVVVSSSISTVLGFVLTYLGTIPPLLFDFDRQIIGWFSLAVVIALLLLFVWTSIEDAFVITVIVLTLAGFIFFAGVVAILIVMLVALAGFLVGFEAISATVFEALEGVMFFFDGTSDSIVRALVTVGIRTIFGVFVITGVLTMAMAIAMIVAGSIAVVGVLIGTVAGILIGTVVGVVTGSEVDTIFVAGNVVTLMLMALVSFYIAWQMLKHTERDAWIRSLAILFAATGGTSFREATLTDANFSRTYFKSTNLRGALLLRTCWRNAKKLDCVRLDKTYLSNDKIQELLLTGHGSHQSFIKTFLKGINLQYSNLTASDFTEATLAEGTLQGANLADAVLTKADLSYVNFQGADLSGSNLYQARLEHINLQGANLREANLQFADLRGIDLANVDLKGANLIEADLSKAILSGANLSGANLSAVQALGTNFEKATFTGACLKDLNINSSTNLKDVVCDYVYLEDDYQERRPHGGSFREGEFTQRFQQVLETVDLFFDDGVDWKAFLTSFQDLQSQYGDENLAVQGIERKGLSSFEIRLAVPPEVDKAEIEKVAYERYEINLKQIEAQYREQLTAKEVDIQRYQQRNEKLTDELLATYRQQNSDLTELVKLAASRPINVEATAVAENKAPKYDMRGAQIAGGLADTVQGGQVGGTINNEANESAEIPSLAEAAAEIQNLLNQLEAANPAATEVDQTAYLNALIPLTKRERFIGALKSAGSAEIEDMPYEAVLKALVERWENSGGQVV